MHYYQFHIGDYRSSTTHLTNEEDLCYRRLIDFYMDTEQPIPTETEWVARRIRIDIHVVNTVLKDFFIEGQNGWNHDICDKNLASYKARDKRNKINGLKGGRPKKENPVGYESQPKKTLTNNHKPIANNQEPITIINNKSKPLSDSRTGEYVSKLENEFNTFWEAYPNKQGKLDAKKHWLKTKPNLETVLQSLKWQLNSDKWVKDNGAFIPMGSTYVRQARWEDEKQLSSIQKLVNAI